MAARCLRRASASRERGCAQYYLEVRPSNRAAQALYARFGFRHVALRRGYYPGRNAARGRAGIRLRAVSRRRAENPRRDGFGTGMAACAGRCSRLLNQRLRSERKADGARAADLPASGESRERTSSRWTGLALKQRVEGCTDCRLRASCRQTVFGVGRRARRPGCWLGEAPGADEDRLGDRSSAGGQTARQHARGARPCPRD
jgi:hypothetical protein